VALLSGAPLIDRAGAVLDGNWMGRATKPAPNLYPHQWSWDSAFIAIGNRHLRWDRAATELTTLFDAQWTNGMVPHIVFAGDDPGYFPSGSVWRSNRSPHCPRGISSSGICQPPVHATAVLAVFRARPDEDGERFVRSLIPKLVAWHDYLHRVRAVGSPLIEIWHPWESGRDNNPEWDGPLSAVRFSPDEVPSYRRVDTDHADAGDRPSDAEYDVYLYLVEQLKANRHEPEAPQAMPFRVRDVLLNSILVRAEHDLARLCDLVGVDSAGRRDRAVGLAEAIHTTLWSEKSGLYHSQNAIDSRLIPARTSGAFLPMLTGSVEDGRLVRLLNALQRDFLVPVGDDGAVPLTIPVDEPGFDAGRYWRGPAWINMCWLIAEGLDAHGQEHLADRLRRGAVTLCAELGFHEYFDPRQRSGHGSDDFSWSAALTVDLIHRSGG